MLDEVLEAIRPRLVVLAEAWLAAGAAAYGLWEEGRPLAQWPDGPNTVGGGPPLLAVPVDPGISPTLELRVTGAPAPGGERAPLSWEAGPGQGAEGRLRAEAALLAHLIQLEGDLEAVTARLIETQDQLLALYDLTHAARTYPNIQDALNSLAKDAARLVKSDSALAVLSMPDGAPLIAQQPLAYLGSEQALALFRRVQARPQELLTDIELLTDGQATPPARCALYLVPIRVRGRVGVLLGLLNRPGREPFASPVIKLARTIAEQGGTQLENALLLQDTLAQARVQTEMELAQRVQTRLLPQRLPQAPGLDLAACARPASQVGGDFYGVLRDSGAPLTLAVGDVSGKGMAAALLVSMVHTAVRTIARLGPQATPAMIVAQANANLYDDLTEVGAFVTLFVGQYDQASRVLSFANAGHSPVIHCPKDGPARLLEADGPGIGVLPVSLCQDQAIRLGPGDLIVAATDGFTEAHNAAGEMYGYEHFVSLVETQARLAASARSARDLLDSLVAAVDRFSAGHPQDDDQTALVLKGIPV